jgi:two-component sensor histidine kinase
MTSAAGATAEPTSVTLFRRTYPGHPSQIGRVRHDLAEVTGGCRIAFELTLLTSELCANAVLHSNSGKRGGNFTVLANVHPGQFARVEVVDQGGAWHPHKHDDDRPHGLDIVREVAGDGNWGVDGDGSANRIVWFRLRWPSS